MRSWAAAGGSATRRSCFHEGPHVLYGDGPIYPWLRQRGLLGRTRSVPLAGLRRFGFRYGGRRRSVPPLALLRVLTVRRAPVEAGFSEWATARFGPRTAAVAAAAAGVGLFHPQPGDLSAAFVHERLRRVFSLPPTGRLPRGRLGRHDHRPRRVRPAALGVRIETETRISRRPDGPTVVATSLAAARTLLDDPTLTWPSGQAALLDLSLRRTPRRRLRGQRPGRGRLAGGLRGARPDPGAGWLLGGADPAAAARR